MVPMTFAMLAWPGNVGDLSIWKGQAVGNLVDSHPEHTAGPVTIVFPEREVVLGHTGYHAGAATGAFVQVDDHAELVGLAAVPSAVSVLLSLIVLFPLMCLFHGNPFLND
jgi:hypothetical protein